VLLGPSQSAAYCKYGKKNIFHVLLANLQRFIMCCISFYPQYLGAVLFMRIFKGLFWGPWVSKTKRE
jgi:hypothetical protein